MGVPGLLYTVQNVFIYLALAHLDPAVFQVRRRGSAKLLQHSAAGGDDCSIRFPVNLYYRTPTLHAVPRVATVARPR